MASALRTSFACLLVALLCAASARAEKLPADAFRRNVTDVEFGAIPDDGLPDDAAVLLALQKLPTGVTSGNYGARWNIVYFPCGVYNFADRFEYRTIDGKWTARVILEGEREDCVVLKLADNAPGFGDPNTPRDFIATGGFAGSVPSFSPATNESFTNDIVDLTINCGSGNPGVRCVDFWAHNQSSMRNVTVKSEDGAGLAGVYAAKNYPGPWLMWNVRVEGFDVGVELGNQMQYQATLFDVELVDQNTYGIDVKNTSTAIDKLTCTQSSATVPCIFTSFSQAHLSVVDSTLTGAASARSAIEVNVASKYYFRGIETTGYATALKDGTVAIAGADIAERVSTGTPYKLFNAPDAALTLPVEYPPAFFYSDPDANPGDWASVITYGAGPGNGAEITDDSAAIQAAMNSGKPAVYFPRSDGNTTNGGLYSVMNEITIPVTVQRIDFQYAGVRMEPSVFNAAGECAFRIAAGTPEDPPLLIQGFNRSTTTIAPASHFCLTGGRRVILTRGLGMNFRCTGEDAKLWVLDIVGGLYFDDDLDAEGEGGCQAWAWQFDAESTAFPVQMPVVGAGTDVRIVGYKQEREFQIANVEDGARLEILGGFALPCVSAGPVVDPTAFVSRDAQMSISIVQHCGGTPNTPALLYPIMVQQQIGNTIRTLPTSATVDSGSPNHRHVPLFNGYPDTEIKVIPSLVDGPPVMHLPQHLPSVTYELTQIDPSEVFGVNMDPGMWTQPASCQSMSHALLSVDKSGDGTMDVDFYTCQETGNGPEVGKFDPATPSTPNLQTNCRNVTNAVTMDGDGEGEAEPDVFAYEGAMGKWVARLNDCNGDCRALITVTCSP